MSNFAVILPAAGKSTRFKDQNYKKPFAILAGRAVWLHSAEKFLARDEVKQVILVISPEDRDYFDMKFSANVTILGITVVEGGKERFDSVAKGLEKVRDDIDFVAIHDAARPCIAEEWIGRVFTKAEETGAAMLGIPVTSTLKKVNKAGTITDTVSRDQLWEAQTPQIFRKDWLLAAYAARGEFSATDDAQLLERAGHPVHMVTGSAINRKITTRDDLKLAEKSIKALPKPKILNLRPSQDDDLWR